MILNLFKKPRWRHRDPQVRMASIDADRLNEDVLMELVDSDPDIDVRCAACEKINAVARLTRLLKDSDQRLSNTARIRLAALIGGNEQIALSLEERLQLIESLEDEALLFELAQKGGEAELRESALMKLDSPQQILMIAINDPASANRVKAVSLLSDKSSLSKVIQRLGKRDKTAYRLARSRLKEINAQEAMPLMIRTRCESICSQLEHLGQLGTWAEDHAKLKLLEQQWAELSNEADDEWHVRFSSGREQFLKNYSSYRTINETEIRAAEEQALLLERAEVILKNLRDGAQGLGAEALQAHIADHTQAWSELAGDDSQQLKAMEYRFSKLRKSLEKQLRQLTRLEQAGGKLATRLEHLEEISAESIPVDSKAAEKAIRETKALVEEISAAPHLRARLHALQQNIDERLSAQRTRAQADLEHLPNLLTRLTETLDRGELKKAEGQLGTIRSQIDLIKKSGLPTHAIPPLEARLHELNKTIQELRKWRKWGTDQHREELCAKMEGLLEGTAEPEAIIDRMGKLQREWKKLDRSGSRENRSLGERFHRAVEAAHVQCQPFLEQQAETHRRNREEKKHLCDQLEAFISNADWENMDWKKAVKAERETRAAWRRIGPVGQKHQGALERRFRRGIKQVEARFAEERERNLTFRRGLIEQMQALADNPDVDASIREAKKLQQHWRTTVTANRSTENRMWKAFREAADQVFERRKRRHQEEQDQIQIHIEHCQSLCRQLSGLCQLDNTDQLESRLQELRKQWQQSRQLDIPAKPANALESEWNQTEERVKRHLEVLQIRRHKRSVELLSTLAALCNQLEQAPGMDDAQKLNAVEAAWAAAPWIENPADRETMEARFVTAKDIFIGSVADQQALVSTQRKNGERRTQICLHLEIVAEIDSPPEYAQERMAFQVSRLSEHMADGDEDPLLDADALQLERRWYLTGPAPMPQAEQLEKRFELIKSALRRQEQ